VGAGKKVGKGEFRPGSGFLFPESGKGVEQREKEKDEGENT